MFDALSTRLQDVFQSLKGETRLTESTVEATEIGQQRGLSGSAIIQQRVTDLVDVEGVLASVGGGTRP